MSPGRKSAIRGLTRRLGYELVPFAGGLRQLQKAVLADRVDLVVDVGANVGQYAERVRHLGYQGPMISFEPGSDAFAHLTAKAAQDSHGWEVRRTALSNTPGLAVLNVSANSVSSSLLKVRAEHVLAAPKAATVLQENVSVSTLDVQLTERAERQIWFKLDVQGHELAVLQGAEQVLDSVVAVQTELSFGHLYAGQSDWLDVCRYLEDEGFTLRYFEPGYEDRVTGYLQQADALFLRDSTSEVS